VLVSRDFHPDFATKEKWNIFQKRKSFGGAFLLCSRIKKKNNKNK